MFSKDERKCFRKGGRRKLENPYYPEGDNDGYVPKKRACQYAMFSALRGYDEALEAARLDAAEEYADK